MIDARLQEAFGQLGWIRVPEILLQQAEIAAKHNMS